MIRPILLAAALAVLPAAAHADAAGAEIEAVVREYVRLWNARDAAAIATRIYRTPAGLGTPEGAARALKQLDDAGYDRSTVTSVEACRMSRDTGMAVLRYTRLLKSGQPMPPKDRAGLYVLRRFPEGWRITDNIPFDATAKLDCASAP